MANQELINYILQYKNQFSSSQLREALLQQGQNPREVDEALQAAMSQQQPSFSPPPLPAASSAGSSGPGQGLNPSTLFTFDQQTKETMMHSAIGLLIWAAFLVGMVDNVLMPKLVERGTQLHPLAILLSVLGGLSFFGLIGFLLGPLTLSLCSALFALYKKQLVQKA